MRSNTVLAIESIVAPFQLSLSLKQAERIITLEKKGKPVLPLQFQENPKRQSQRRMSKVSLDGEVTVTPIHFRAGLFEFHPFRMLKTSGWRGLEKQKNSLPKRRLRGVSQSSRTFSVQCAKPLSSIPASLCPFFLLAISTLRLRKTRILSSVEEKENPQLHRPLRRKDGDRCADDPEIELGIRRAAEDQPAKDS
ncbi:hypothetical protein SLEP1_g59146, partial [Rubroshorea leprosula]